MTRKCDKCGALTTYGELNGKVFCKDCLDGFLSVFKPKKDEMKHQCPKCKSVFVQVNPNRTWDCVECGNQWTPPILPELKKNQCPSCYVTLDEHKDRCPACDWKFDPSPEDNVPEERPKTEILSPGVDQIPFEGLEAIGEIFAEGEVKYGRDNWKKSPNDDGYNQERTRHAIRHLFLWANGDRSENHLAKVAWFCVTTIWREKNQGD